MLAARALAGHEEYDHSGLITVLEDLAGHRVGGASA